MRPFGLEFRKFPEGLGAGCAGEFAVDAARTSQSEMTKAGNAAEMRHHHNDLLSPLLCYRVQRRYHTELGKHGGFPELLVGERSGIRHLVRARPVAPGFGSFSGRVGTQKDLRQGKLFKLWI